MRQETAKAIDRIKKTMCPTSGLVNRQFTTRIEGRVTEADLGLLLSELSRLEQALKFYARHIHWMPLTSDADCLQTLLVAMQGDGEQHGWRVAEDALTEVTHPVVQP